MTTLSLRILPREVTRPRRRSVTVPVRGWLATVKLAWRRWHSRNLLSQLDDFMLKDIVLTRADVWYEAGKPFWRE
jgi:uncharacterized protein YjiS (DUF1127 family)